MSKQPVVSVIMPIYNVEGYLEESLESVLNQTLRDIEIICVDDGSTDTSGEIIDRYAIRDDRIVVVHKPNAGYGHSMNVGMQYASGEYVAIVEPDDLIKKEMLEDLYVLAKKQDVDFVKSDYAELYGKKEAYRILPMKLIHDKSLYNTVLQKEQIAQLYNGKIAHWTGLYKRNFLEENKILFHESPGAAFQDQGFWFQTLFYAKKIYLTGQYYYLYRQDNPNSSINSKQKVYCVPKEFDFIFDRLKEKTAFMSEYLSWFIKRRYAECRYTFEKIAEEYREEFLSYMSEELRECQKKGLLDLQLFSETEKLQLFMIMQEPEQFYEAWKNREKKLNSLCEECSTLYIYGAGYIAERTFGFLTEKNKKKLCGFIVTEKREQEQKLFGFPVYSYRELVSDEERGILIGVSDIYRQEIKNILEEAQEKKIIELTYELI